MSFVVARCQIAARKRCVGALLALSVSLGPRLASADGCETEENTKLLAEGRRLYDLGRFDEASERWEQAYLACDRPRIVFNLAQARRRAGRRAQALALYKRWLELEPQISSAERADVEEKIRSLEPVVPAEEGQSQPAPDVPPVRLAPQQPGEPLVTQPRSAPARPTPRRAPNLALRTEAPAEPSNTRAWYADGWGWTLAGTGAVLVGVGAGWMSYAASNETQHAGPDDSVDVSMLAGSLSASFGALLLGAGIVKLLLVDGKSAPRAAAGTSAGLVSARF